MKTLSQMLILQTMFGNAMMPRKMTVKRFCLREGTAQEEYDKQCRMNAGKLEKQRRRHELKMKGKRK